MTLKEYNIGDEVRYIDDEDKHINGTIIKRFSANPNGPLTYYDVYNIFSAVETVHISKIIGLVYPKPVSIREEVLDEAKRIVTKDRNTNYGSPESNLGTIAKFWSEYLHHEITPHDVAAMMVLMKVSRIMTSPNQKDHWVDIAGYAAIGAEVRALTILGD